MMTLPPPSFNCWPFNQQWLCTFYFESYSSLHVPVLLEGKCNGFLKKGLFSSPLLKRTRRWEETLLPNGANGNELTALHKMCPRGELPCLPKSPMEIPKQMKHWFGATKLTLWPLPLYQSPQFQFKKLQDWGHVIYLDIWYVVCISQDIVVYI